MTLDVMCKYYTMIQQTIGISFSKKRIENFQVIPFVWHFKNSFYLCVLEM